MERMDDLQFAGLHLIQDPDRFCFGTDAVLLSAFTNLKPRERALDLCAGTGVIATLLKARTGAQLEALEIDPDLCDMFSRSCAHNGLPIPIHAMDMRDAAKALGHGSFDAVVCNPPYFEGGSISPSPARALSRHGSIEDAASAAAKLLKNGGRFFVCYPSAQLVQLLCVLREVRLEPKRLRMVSHTAFHAPYLALVECKKQAAPGLRVEKGLFLCEPDGTTPSAEYKEIYHL